MESFGVFIKAEREKRGIRLEEIASITKIHLHTLEMLEEGEWDKLPPEPFIRGFITAYGKYVGLDTRDLIQRYAEEVGERTPPPESLTPPQDVPQTPRSPGQIIDNAGPFPLRRLLSGLGMVGVIGLLFTVVYLGKKASESAREGRNLVTSVAPGETTTETTETGSESSADGTETTETTQTAETAEAGGETATQTADASESVLPKPSERATSATTPAGAFAHNVVIKGQESTWVKIYIDDQPPVEAFLKQGESASYQAREKIKVTLGNSTGAEVTHNGNALPGKQFLGTIRTYQYPENARFPRDNGRNPLSTTRRD